MSSTWTVPAAVTAFATAITPYLMHRRQQAARRTDARLARLQTKYEGELATIRRLLAGLDRLRADLQVVLAEGPLCTDRLAELDLAGRLDELAAPLKIQLFGRPGLEALRERVRYILGSPYPETDAGAQWNRAVREAIGCGARQQAAAHAALESLRELARELQLRETELTSKVLTLVGR